MIPPLGKGQAQTDGSPPMGTYSSSGWTLPTLGEVGGMLNTQLGNLGGELNRIGMTPQPTFGQMGGAINQAVMTPDPTLGLRPTTSPFVGRGQAQTDASPTPSPFLDRGADNASQSRLGVSGGVGSPFSQTLGGNTGGFGGSGGGNGGGLGGSGAVKPPMTQRDVLQQQLDQRFGQGWSANFTSQNGLDPISFYEREVPSHITDPAERASIAMQRAGNDAQYHPNEIADWQQKHGNTPISDDQWKIWSKINQGGGPDYNAGKGVDPYGVH